MKKPYRALTFLAFYLIFETLVSQVFGQDPYYFKHNGNEEDLSNNTIMCSLQDQKKGFVSPTGLNRYDNYEKMAHLYHPKWYALKEMDQDWRYLNSNRTVHDTNIHPESSRYPVSTPNDQGQWVPNLASLGIQIMPSFWESDLAYTLYVLVALYGIVTFFIVYRIKKKLEIEKHLLEMEYQKEKEVYDKKIRFFTSITHEVRTPLSLIKIPLDKIIKEQKCPKDTMENLIIMKRNTDRLLNLTNQILDFRKTEKEMFRLSFDRHDLCRLIEDIYQRFLPSIEEANIDFTLHRPSRDCFVSLDKETITKIMSNLFTNAIRYSNGKVDVHMELNPQTEMVRIRVNSDGHLIHSEMHEKIFSPFFRVENPKNSSINGTGLGLSLAQSLAELHHGKLFLDTSIRTLNSFVLEFPIKQGQPYQNESVDTQKALELMDMPLAQVENDDFEDSPKQSTILIVEDEEELRKLIARELSPKYNILTAVNGADAMAILEKHNVNLIISDVLMPVMDGYQLCKKLKEDLNTSHISIILLTASINLNARIEGLYSGADAYLEKPFTLELLMAQIDNLFRSKNVARKNFINSPFSHYRTVAVNKMDENFMKQLHDIIITYLCEADLSVEMIANKMGMSASTLYRKVKAITKLNTNEYIRLYRLKKAAEMLTSNKYRVNEVSYLVGFSSPSYFATSFQKQFGLSPSKFVKQQKNQHTLPSYKTG